MSFRGDKWAVNTVRQDDYQSQLVGPQPCAFADSCGKNATVEFRGWSYCAADGLQVWRMAYRRFKPEVEYDIEVEGVAV